MRASGAAARTDCHRGGVAGEVDHHHVGARARRRIGRELDVRRPRPMIRDRSIRSVVIATILIASSSEVGVNVGTARSTTRSTTIPSDGGERRCREHPDLGVVDHRAPEREVGDEQRHGEADPAEHRHPGDVAQAAGRRGARRCRARSASADAPRMPTNLPTTSPTTMPMVTRLDSAWSMASPLRITPAFASAKIGTITKLDTGCSRVFEPLEHRHAAARERGREQPEHDAGERRLDARFVEAQPQERRRARRTRADGRPAGATSRRPASTTSDRRTPATSGSTPLE